MSQLTLYRVELNGDTLRGVQLSAGGPVMWYRAMRKGFLFKYLGDTRNGEGYEITGTGTKAKV